MDFMGLDGYLNIRTFFYGTTTSRCGSEKYSLQIANLEHGIL